MKQRTVDILFGFCALLIGPLLCMNAWSADTPIPKPVVVIDAGHTRKAPGAISITGSHEVEYNDALVAKTANAISRAGFVPILTRRQDQDITLEERAEVANAYNALAMLSIHHDSAQLIHLESLDVHGKKAYRTREPIAGYSLFVSKKNQQFDASLMLARLLGEELQKLGRKPSLHHAEAIPGEGRVLLDTRLGIYEYDDLVVLKKTAVPAVLLEVGVIVDKADEAYVARNDHQEAIVNAIVESLRKFNTAGKRLRGS